MLVRLAPALVGDEILTSALKDRLRAVLDEQPVTEAELRQLSEEGQACELILNGLLERERRRLAKLTSNPASSLAEVAAAYRDVNGLQSDKDELRHLLTLLQGRARQFRASWLGTSRLPPPRGPRARAR